MEMTIKQEEKGQIMVILVLVLVAVLGLVAVAIDGGMVYTDRRHDQNAADSAALAGAAEAAQIMSNSSNYYYQNFKCGTIGPVKSSAVNKVIARASSNKITLTEQNLDTAESGVQTLCTSSGMNRYLDIRVKVTTSVQTSFAHLFYNGELKNTVEAVSRIRPRTPYTLGNAIIALDTDCSYGGIKFSGNNDVIVQQGGIFSNSCMSKQGNSGTIHVADAPVSYHTTWSGHTGPFDANKPTQTTATITMPPLVTPDCSAVDDYRGSTPGANLTPGRYNGMSGDRHLAPGLYCFYGDIDLQGSHGLFEGDDVTIYFVSGGFRMTGNGEVHLTASASETPAGHAMKDVVIMMAPGNSSDLTLLGNSDSDYTGLIVAPNQHVEIGGTADNMSLHTQIIARDVELHGNPTINVYFTDSSEYSYPVRLELEK